MLEITSVSTLFNTNGRKQTFVGRLTRYVTLNWSV